MNNPAEQAVIGPMAIVAADQYETSPLVHDPWARWIPPPNGRYPATLARLRARPAGNRRSDETRISRGWANFLSCKRYVDHQLVNAVAKGVEAIVILGSGYDMRSNRLPSSPGAQFVSRSTPQHRSEDSVGAPWFRPRPGERQAGCLLRDRQSRRATRP